MDPGQAVGVGLLGLGRLLGVVDILQHHGGAGQADLALLAVGDLLLGAGLDDLIIGIREGDADGALLLLVDGGQAAGGDALGGAVALPDGDGCAVLLQEASNRFFSSTDRLSPPENTPSRQLRSAPSISFTRSRASNREGTPAMRLGLCFLMSSA